MDRHEQSSLVWTGLGLVFASSLPDLIVEAAASPPALFIDLGFNPGDGHSLLAKNGQRG
jgi:hypothetical protein